MEPLAYLQEWGERLALTRPELLDGTPYHTMLHRALSGLVRWCTALDPRQRPSMLMVACVLQVLPLGRWDRLAGLYQAQRSKCPHAPRADVDEAFLAALEARRSQP